MMPSMRLTREGSEPIGSSLVTATQAMAEWMSQEMPSRFIAPSITSFAMLMIQTFMLKLKTS